MMKYPLHYKFWAAGLLSIFVLASCSSSENTVVINDAPTTTGRSDTTEQQTEPTNSFQQLTIGENQQIRTLDPLFIESTGSMRAVQLIYEGLVRYNENEKIIPAVASEWTVKNDQKTYRFTLRDDLFYQDSNIFNNGRGRRLVAADVKQVFERMAKATVPDRAAQFFMDIKGFEPYYREQHQVMMKSDRQLGGVSGITTPNDSTVVFSLVNSDSQFLKKLATPYAVIYPQESVTDAGFKAVGTGPFRLSQQRSDSLYIFSRFDNYYQSNQPRLDRIDIATSTSETALLNALSRGDVQIIPELGPRQIQIVTDNNGQLNNTLSDSYRLTEFQESPLYRLQYNPGADISKGSVSQALAAVQSTSFFADLPKSMGQLDWTLPKDGSASKPDSLASSYSGDPIVQSFYATLSQQLSSHGVNFHMESTRVANRNTAIFTTQSFSFSDEKQSQKSDRTLATFTLQKQALVSKQINNFTFNNFSWWINLSDARVSSTNNQ